MGQGEHAVQVVFVVEQHIGVTQGAGGVGAGPLAHVLVHVDPAVVKALLDDGAVGVAHGGQGLIDGVLGLLVGDDLVRAGHHGGVDVVHVELVHPQQLLAQTDIAVHFVHVLVDEVVVHLGGHPGAGHGGGQGAVVLPGGGEELQLLDLGGEHRGGGVADGAVGLIIGFKGVFPQRPVEKIRKTRLGLLEKAVGKPPHIH